MQGRKWIPVKDKMPENDEPLVLITYWDEFGDKSARFKVVDTAWYCYESGEWCSYAINGVYDVYTEVIAWMPLPDPYEEG